MVVFVTATTERVRTTDIWVITHQSFFKKQHRVSFWSGFVESRPSFAGISGRAARVQSLGWGSNSMERAGLAVGQSVFGESVRGSRRVRGELGRWESLQATPV